MVKNDHTIDAIDRTILNILQSDGRIANVEIARRVGLAPSAVLERIRKLEERQVVLGYTARVRPAALGQGLLAFVYVRSDEPGGGMETPKQLARIPEVQEVHNIAGEDCYLVKVRVQDTGALGRLLREEISALPAVRSTRTTIVLDTLKESTVVPAGPGLKPSGPRRRRR
jgi:Lrp/AsnC family leucine-responsive transcriptional regulator